MERRTFFNRVFFKGVARAWLLGLLAAGVARSLLRKHGPGNGASGCATRCDACPSFRNCRRPDAIALRGRK